MPPRAALLGHDRKRRRALPLRSSAAAGGRPDGGPPDATALPAGELSACAAAVSLLGSAVPVLLPQAELRRLPDADRGLLRAGTWVKLKELVPVVVEVRRPSD